MVTTEGWLFHLAPEGQRTLGTSEIPGFGNLVTYRPPDQGLPQVPPDAPPADTSGALEEDFIATGKVAEAHASLETNKVTLPLLSHIHTRLVHGTMLEFSFRLSVRARIRLLGKRARRVVASTSTKTFAPGSRKLLMQLNLRAWPTKLALQSHALAPLKVVSSVTGEGANIGTESTAAHFLPRSLISTALGKLP